MKILVIDTSCKTAMAALAEDGKIIASIQLQDNKTHSVKMLPAVEYILSASDMTPKDIELIGVTNGPGSYTGLRIGVTTAKTFAYALNIPLFGINTLEALAASCDFRAKNIICPMIDARNSRVYTALYSGGKCLREAAAMACTELCEILKGDFAEQNIIFTGDGSIVNQKILHELMGDRYVQVPGEFACGNPAAIAQITARIYCEAKKSGTLDEFTAESLKVNYYKNYTDSI